MSGIADGKHLSELSIPGTHDSGARFEPYMGLAKCQDLTIADQLAAGVRYFDVRCHHYDDQFLIYHGSIDQNQTFDELLQTMYTFLDAHPRETLVVSIKEEGTAQNPVRSFEDTFASYVAQAPSRWVLDPQVPLLGSVRGKLVLLRRFDATHVPTGIDATNWPDDMTFDSTNADATLHVEDEYMVSDDALKWTAITNALDLAKTGAPSTLFLTYTSGYQTIQGLPNIPSVADTINMQLDTRFAGAGHDRLGVLAMDFITAARAKAVIATNATGP